MIDATFNTERLVEWCRAQYHDLSLQVIMLEAGEMTTGFQEFGEPHKDTTQQSIDQAKRKLNELEHLLKDMAPPGFQSQVKP